MIWEIFVFGGILFWLFSAAELILILGCLHFRRGGSATVSLLVFLMALWLFGDINVFLWAWNNPVYAGWGALGYVIVAVLWGFAKWAMFQLENSSRYKELRNKFLQLHKIEGEDIPSEMKPEWRDWFDTHNRPDDWENEVEFNPLASDHKATIMGWMILWPISVVWTFIDDAVIKLFRHLYHMMYGWLEKIRKYYWGRFEADMPTQEDYDARIRRKQAERERN